MYLSLYELARLKEPMLIAPYKCHNGVVLNESQVMQYNRYTQDINDCRCVKTRNQLKDNRHKMFCLLSGMSGA